MNPLLRLAEEHQSEAEPLCQFQVGVRDATPLLAWLDNAVPGTLLPAEQLAARIRALPITEVSDPKTRPPEHLLTADEVAEWLCIDRQRVYRLARDGMLSSIRLGNNTLRFRKTEIDRWLKRRTG